MSIPVSIKMSALLGKRVVLTRDFEGYPSGSFATVEQFVITAERSFFHLLFEDIPGSLEEMSPVDFARSLSLIDSEGVTRPVGGLFCPGVPPQDRSYNLSVS